MCLEWLLNGKVALANVTSFGEMPSNAVIVRYWVGDGEGESGGKS